MWPFPGLYFMEVIFLPALLAFSAFKGWPQRARIASSSAGALSVFSILGAMSVGLFYLPLVLLAVLMAAISRVVTRERFGECVAFFAGSAVLQAFGMLFLVSVV
jgi:hypothetical protein